MIVSVVPFVLLSRLPFPMLNMRTGVYSMARCGIAIFPNLTNGKQMH